jgi:hypothetical protein
MVIIIRAICSVAVFCSAPRCLALPQIDDFFGGLQIVTLEGMTPGEFSAGTFYHAPAAGGLREVYARTDGYTFALTGINLFSSSWYTSVLGYAESGILWDGVAGAIDKNNDGFISVADDFDFGLNLDFVQNCASPMLHLQAIADKPGESVDVILANSASDFALYSFPITTIDEVADYYIPIFSPSYATGGFDPNLVHAVALRVKNANISLNLSVSALGGYCEVIPEPGTWMAIVSLVGITGMFWRCRS